MDDLQFTYRRVTLDDLELLTAARVEFFADSHKELTDAQKADLYADNMIFYEETLADGSFTAFLALDGDTLAGIGGVNFFRIPPKPKNKTGRSAYISNMYTRPEYRGRGIATKIFALLVDEARERGCGKVILHASDMGRPIYEKYGFNMQKNAMEYYC